MHSRRKVTFNENMNQVHLMIAWKFAYSTARKTYWEYLAVDRYRFELRIKAASVVISPILDPQHRCKIYKQRFTT